MSKAKKLGRMWKVTDAQGRACHGGTFQYDLPRWSRTKGWVPGAWTPRVKVDACTSGYHVCRDDDLRVWIGGFTNKVWACEGRGKVQVADDKVVYESIRLTCPTPWNETSARLWAVECASDVLSLYERQYPNDDRVFYALDVATQYALGLTDDRARAAAWAAAWAAAGDAAWAAARDAAWAAAGAVAGDAAWAAARAAAWAAARAAQTRRLLWWIGAEVHADD